jgi:hypothetical protein
MDESEGKVMAAIKKNSCITTLIGIARKNGEGEKQSGCEIMFEKCF